MLKKVFTKVYLGGVVGIEPVCAGNEGWTAQTNKLLKISFYFAEDEGNIFVAIALIVSITTL